MATQRHAFAADHERIANLALTAYRELPAKGAKPGLKSNNRLEWTVLAAFVLSYPSSSDRDEGYAVISLATGLKCLPYTALPLNGDVLHDQHAEVLAKRGARQWLMQRLEHEVKSGAAGLVALFEPVEGARRWRLREGVRLHLYVSTLPCGDASNKLLEFQRTAQDQVAGRKDVLSPGELLELELASHEAPTTTSSIGSSSVMRGRALSSQTQSTQTTTSGSLRTKPGRPDSPPSICMSCSDKIALWNAPGIGMQGSLLSSLIEPVYIHSITICDHPVRHIFPAFPHPSLHDEGSYEKQREALKTVLSQDCRRALQRSHPTSSPSIIVGWSTAPFPDSKEARIEKAWSAFTTSPANARLDLVDQATFFKANHEPESCPNSILFIRHAFQPGEGRTENLASGTKMGASTKRPKPKNQVPGHSEPLRPPARSAVCRLNYFQSFVSAYDSIMATSWNREVLLYGDAKGGTFGEGSRAYRRRKDDLLGSKEVAHQVVKAFLRGARDRTAIKGEAQQDQLQDTTPVSEFEKAEHTNESLVFKGWLRTSSAFSRFNLDGGIISQ